MPSRRLIVFSKSWVVLLPTTRCTRKDFRHRTRAMNKSLSAELRESFTSSGFAPDALKFFDALAAILTGNGRKH